MLSFVDYQNNEFFLLLGQRFKCLGETDFFPEPDFVHVDIHVTDTYRFPPRSYRQSAHEFLVTSNSFSDSLDDDSSWIFRQVLPKIGVQHNGSGVLQGRPQIFAGKSGLPGSAWCCQKDT
ncbi:hypothetical protein D3C72_1594760 [compost metagenome]